MLDLKVLLEETRAAVQAAGEIILAHWNQPRQIEHKGRIDLLTQTDLAVERELLSSLALVLPETGFLAEESAAKAGLSGLKWIIDPLDGTTNFAHGFPFVCTSVALCRDGRSLLGVVHAPILGETYCAGLGLGTTLNGRAVKVSEAGNLLDCLVCTGFPYAVRENLRVILAQAENVLAETQGLRRTGAAALDLAQLACGRFDVFYEMGLKPWDTAAGTLLVEEAGGRVSRFNPDTPHFPGAPDVLASNSLVHEEFAPLLRV